MRRLWARPRSTDYAAGGFVAAAAAFALASAFTDVAPAWTPNLGASCLEIAATIAIVDRIVRREHHRLAAPRVTHALHIIRSTVQQAAEIVATDYVIFARDWYVPGTAQAVVSRWFEDYVRVRMDDAAALQQRSSYTASARRWAASAGSELREIVEIEHQNFGGADVVALQALSQSLLAVSHDDRPDLVEHDAFLDWDSLTISSIAYALREFVSSFEARPPIDELDEDRLRWTLETVWANASDPRPNHAQPSGHEPDSEPTNPHQ